MVRLSAKIGLDSLAFYLHTSPEVSKTEETTLEDSIYYFGRFCVITNRVIHVAL